MTKEHNLLKDISFQLDVSSWRRDFSFINKSIELLYSSNKSNALDYISFLDAKIVYVI